MKPTVALALALFIRSYTQCPDNDHRCISCVGNTCAICVDSFRRADGSCEAPQQRVSHCLAYNANGTCRSCIARVLKGRVHHRIEWPGLSAEEKAEGWVLPCVALADSDVVLWQPLSSAPCTTSCA